MFSLGEKLKMPKPCEKPFYKNIRVNLCEKPLEKTPNIREMGRFWKSVILQRSIAHAKALQSGQFETKIKNGKNMFCLVDVFWWVGGDS